jgi:rfaE bifunctional protein kinase chain/domain
LNPDRLEIIVNRYASLRLGIVGDFCLDRYLEIDPSKNEVSIETGLPVYNVVSVRSQPGGAGTILNNLVALGVKEIFPVGFAGVDGEGFELERSLRATRGVRMDHFLRTERRRTFTYTKPLLMHPGKAPVELSRLDFKNWSATARDVTQHFRRAVLDLATQVDAIILLDQVDLENTGVVTSDVLDAIRQLAAAHPQLLIVADSRRSLRGFPPVCFKMNRAEFKTFAGLGSEPSMDLMKDTAAQWATKHRRFVFVSLAENGILGAAPDGTAAHAPALPVRGEIDIVGAGDAVTANLVAALSSGATLSEALELAMLAASIVVHQLGTTGTASIPQLRELNQASSQAS